MLHPSQGSECPPFPGRFRFGQGIYWDRSADQALFKLFVNARDPHGVVIENLERGDSIQVLSLSGTCSFDKGNAKLIGSLIGIADIGAKVVTGAYAPELLPLIDKAGQYAKENFKGSQTGKRRDGYGQKAGKDEFARQEGGVLITMPGSGGPYYSGDGLNRGRWTKSGKKARYDDVRPKHVDEGYFTVRGEAAHNTRFLRSNGSVHVLVWDWKHQDNQGHYGLEVRVVKAAPRPEPVVD